MKKYYKTKANSPKLTTLGFTLIELIAVLVIMAIIALIVTPLVMSIIRKVKLSADKRSIDAYGRSIELAIAGYLMDTGTFPNQISQLTIEYSGDEVVCSTTQLKDDGSVYLAECTVGGREVSGYTYGKNGGETPSESYTAYSVGDEVSYNSVDYFVIEDSDSTESTVKLLKAEPLSVNEVNTYGSGHVNMHVTDDTTVSYYQTAHDKNGYGGMAYYTSETCGNVNDNYVYSGCTTSYASSEIKYVVDAWKNVKAPLSTEVRLITFAELTDNLGFEYYEEGTSSGYRKTESTPNWVNNNNYIYWTMSQYSDSMFEVSVVGYDKISFASVANTRNGGDLSYAVRPVIVLSKTAL